MAVTVLWGLAALLYFVGDTTMTVAVLELGGFERNELARAFVDVYGYPGLAIQKLLVFGLLYLLWNKYPTGIVGSKDPWRLSVPALVAARGLHLTAIGVGNVLALV